MIQKTYKISISGQVQGVGFRPYVYSLATEFLLTGTVSNNEEGVIIFVSGLKKVIFNFYDKLIQSPPPVSIINDSRINQIEYRFFDEFKIMPSKKSSRLNLPLTPDFAICDNCKNDMHNPKNRRFDYPFTTCVNCGPRWAITETFPFERNHTSIDDFPMCEACVEEYTKPIDRRFHSQTNTCQTCGIKLFLVDNSGYKLEASKHTLFKKVANILSDGNIIAIKNTSGYLLCCNAENEHVVQELRDKKNRPHKPFAVLYPSLDFLKKELQLNEPHVKSLTSTERPITIIPFNNYKGNIAIHKVAPGLSQLGVMLPYSGILQLLANELSFPIVATSGNIHGSPIISKNDKAFEKLKEVADYFLQHNLKVTHPQDDSVVKLSNKFKEKVLFRRSRGYAPNYFNASINSDKKIIALGAHLKSSIAFYPNNYLYISQYLGNLDNYDVYERFTKTTLHFIDLFEQKPNVVLVDKHPTYHSTLYGIELAQQHDAELFKIQHHKAHFASVLGEHNLFTFHEPVLGVIWDGTGYGDDGHIWGGEFFKYQPHKIERVSHFEYFNWLAGDKMSKAPKLSLLSLSNSDMQSVLKDKFSDEELTIYQSLKKNNKLKTSSVGRLFDAVASLLNICDINTYEGEAAILLENYITDYNLDDCKLYCSILDKNLIPTEKLLYNLHLDVKEGHSKQYIITNFLYTLASIIFQMASHQKVKKIACSGGVFQNTTLIDMIKEIGENKYKLYFNRNLAPNDENISFGQIMYYLHCLNS
ncbi:carbamoyltransferase HypF [Flavivirga rizhaonensis]|uniref:carbamoyltransferase HypF n=1 Tax=Flavivirga rizhaonensis TaxID=2559571 RepID=UPI001476E0BA|nr:carbamoyltransferase HypF [Flavivirga rizhaonensis]